MPPAKKQKKGLSPIDAYSKRLDSVLDREKCKGSMLIVGVNTKDESDNDEHSDSVLLTAAQVAKLRHIAINDSRDKALDEGFSFASCGQSEDDCPISFFNTSTGNEVVGGIRHEVKKALKKSTSAAQFDSLFGLTLGLQRYDSWMHDNEEWEPGGELEKAIKSLAKAWRDTLKKSDAELGIDAEFTRPGIEGLLETLADDFECCEATAHFRFKWRP